MAEKRKWKEIGANEQIKLSLSVFLCIAAVVLGFISFILLKDIPNSVIGLNCAWLSTALGLLGLSSYVSTQVLKMENKFKDKINELDDAERRIRNDRKRFKDDIEEEA